MIEWGYDDKLDECWWCGSFKLFVRHFVSVNEILVVVKALVVLGWHVVSMWDQGRTAELPVVLLLPSFQSYVAHCEFNHLGLVGQLLLLLKFIQVLLEFPNWLIFRDGIQSIIVGLEDRLLLQVIPMVELGLIEATIEYFEWHQKEECCTDYHSYPVQH